MDRELKYEDWMKEGENRFGKSLKDWKFVCPSCGNVQCYWDFKKLGLKDSEIKDIVFFSCIGRWLDNCKGNIGNKKSPCNYTNGGLFNLSKLKVISDEGKTHSVFEFAGSKLTVKAKNG